MRSLLPTRGYVPRPTTAVLTLLILGSLFLPAPFVILAPGDPQNVLGSAIKISGTQTYPTTGKLSVTAVMITDPDGADWYLDENDKPIYSKTIRSQEMMDNEGIKILLIKSLLVLVAINFCPFISG